MRLYHAGCLPGATAEPWYYNAGMRNRLLSFYFSDHLAKLGFAYWADNGIPEGGSTFIDSGAFSALTLGKPVDLGAYCEFLQARPAVKVYAALDVIGDFRASRVNFKAMEARGLDPIPTFHRGSPMAELERVADDHPSYIALGGIVSEKSGREVLQGWLDECWAVLGKRWPIRVHAFGIIAQWCLERYPFYSADSSSAIISAAMGRVATFTNGRMTSGGWASYAREHMDGTVVDKVGATGSAHLGRGARNVAAILALEGHITRVWKRRGVTWEN